MGVYFNIFFREKQKLGQACWCVLKVSSTYMYRTPLLEKNVVFSMLPSFGDTPK